MLNLILHTLLSLVRSHHSLSLENLALRQQLLVLQRSNPKPAFNAFDRAFWVLLSRVWPGWRRPLRLVKPETIIAWHRKGWRLWWKWKSRPRDPGRPRIPYEVIDVLHRRGYERLRIVPGMSPSGMHWRCSVTRAGNITPEHGAMPIDFYRQSAHYTSASQNDYFDWEDAKDDGAEQLADKFLERHPEICEKGRGADPEYAAWFGTMVELARTGAFPIPYDDFDDEPNPERLPTTGEIENGLRATQIRVK